MAKRLEHHRFSKLFPLHDGQPLWELRDDIKANGLKNPILVYQDQILDGRRREAACAMGGITPSFKQFKGNDEQALALVVSLNLKRRHLGEGERGIVAAKIVEMQNISQREAAEKLNVSPRTVHSAVNVINDGAPELREAVEDGTLSVSDAASIVDEPAKVQREAVKDVKKGKAKTAKAAVENRNGKHLFLLTEFTAPFGQVVRAVDRFFGAYDMREGASHTRCQALLGDVLDIFNKAFAKATKAEMETGHGESQNHQTEEEEGSSGEGQAGVP